jgi:hypothetical protein
MQWVLMAERKPAKDGYYYWKGKSNYGGFCYYYEEGGFDFDMSIPVNKVDEDSLMWLDESEPDDLLKEKPSQRITAKNNERRN